MSSKPAAAKTSASPTLPAVIPTAPDCTWRRPISTHLCVLTCGLRSRSCSAAKLCIRSMLRCMTSTSTIGEGVSTRSTRRVEYSLEPVHAALLALPNLVDVRSAPPPPIEPGAQLVCGSYTAVQTIWISTGLFRGRPGDADRGAGVPPVLTQHLDEQLTRRVGDPRLLTELRRAGHEHQHLHDPHPVQVSHRVRSDGERVQRGLTREIPGRLHLDVAAKRALSQQLAVLVRQLPGHVDAGVNTSGGSRTSSRHRRREGPDRGPGAAPSPNRSWC